MITFLSKIKLIYINIISNKYARLARLHNIAPIYLTLFPSLWAIAFIGKNFSQIIYYSLVMFVGAIAARSTGCIINDLVDRKLDVKIHRTSTRPLASGEVNNMEAIILLILNGLIALVILLTLPKLSIICGLISIPMIIIYPFLKRFTYYPQIFLGFTFNMGVFVGWFSVSSSFSYGIVTLYAACDFWTIGYDTIYGHQDRIDDLGVGNKSLSIKVGENTPEFVWAVYKIMITFISITGLMYSVNFIFYIMVAFATYYLYWQALSVNINDPVDCSQKFRSNIHIGLILWIAVLIGRL